MRWIFGICVYVEILRFCVVVIVGCCFGVVWFGVVWILLGCEGFCFVNILGIFYLSNDLRWS